MEETKARREGFVGIAVKRGFLQLIFFTLLIFQAKALDLLPLFKAGEIWQKSPNAFVIAHRRDGFVFTDDTRSSALSTKREDMTFGGAPVYEARVFWSSEKLSRVEVSIYNKGDAERLLSQKAFEKLILKTSSILDANFGKGVSSPQERLSNHMLAKSKRWSGSTILVQLQWAFTKPHRDKGDYKPFSAEYLRITLVPSTGFAAADNASLTGKSILVKPKGKSALRKSVTREAKGDVYITGIPMVDQGNKGYCAASTGERVLRYYGLLVDQHQVAQLAETSAKSGTSFEGLADAIEKIGRSFSLDKDVLIRSDGGGDFSKSDTADDLKEYNKIAKRRGRATIDWQDHSTLVGPNMLSIDVASIWSAMDPEVLLESKRSQRTRFDAFSRDITKFVDAGIPLMWSCLVGLYPEVPDLGIMGVFGHMRLIIGYNKRTKEILYSDSWGAGHELKRMPIDMAWAMTKGLVVLKPRN